MRFVAIRVFGACLALAGALSAHAQNVIEDDEASISRAEMQATVERWPNDMRVAAANNPETRDELAKLSLVAKKVAQSAEQVTLESDPEFYWDLKLQVQMLVRRLVVKHYLDNIEMPDLDPLARERYAADKDEYAKVDERRLSSHILFLCTPQKCDYEDVGKLAGETLAALRKGADFAEMVEKYSDDKGTKAKGGEFRWAKLGESGVSPEYTKALFAINKVGDYSDVVSTKFGLHIIRLDGIEPAYYKPYDEVAARIKAEITNEYRKLAAMEFDRKYAPTDNLVIDEAVLDEMLAPYKTSEAGADAASPAQAGGSSARNSGVGTDR